MIQLTAAPVLIAIVCVLAGFLIGMSFSRSRFRSKLRDAERVIRTELEREREELSEAVHQHLGSVRKVLSDALEAHDKATEVVHKQLTRPIDMPRLDVLESGQPARIETSSEHTSSESSESQLDMLDSLEHSNEQQNLSEQSESPEEPSVSEEDSVETEDEIRAGNRNLGGLNGSHAQSATN